MQTVGTTDDAAADVDDTSTEPQVIKVYARVRPASHKGDISVRSRFGQSRVVQVRNLEFSLEWVFDERASQETTFDIAGRGIVEAVLGGSSSTLLAYGQTGSGKTHTVFGPDDVFGETVSSPSSLAREAVGLLPRACAALFDGMAADEDLAHEADESGAAARVAAAMPLTDKQLRKEKRKREAERRELLRRRSRDQRRAGKGRKVA